MRRLLMTLCFITVCTLAARACSQQTLDTALRNLTADECANPQQFINNLPQGLIGITPATELAAVQAQCAAEFGTAPAPTPAPGMTSIFTAPTPTSAPTSAASPAKG